MKNAIIATVIIIFMGFIGLNLWGIFGGIDIAESGAIVFSIAAVAGLIIYDNNKKPRGR